MESFKVPPQNCEKCEECPSGMHRIGRTHGLSGCADECKPCVCQPQPSCMPPPEEQCASWIPPQEDENGCITGCGTCCPVLRCAQPECPNPFPPTLDDQGCQVDCGSCPPGVEPTCELVEKCHPEKNDCFQAEACGDKNSYFTAEFCTGTECIITENNIPLMPCVTDNCEAVEAVELDYACPPPPTCPTEMLMCEGVFTPTDDHGCVTGCQQCPLLVGEQNSPSPRSESPVDVITECDQLVGAITTTDKESDGFMLEPTDEPCRIHDGMLYHGMWEPSNYDVVDTIEWIDPDVLPCAKQWAVSGDLVCYCPCDEYKYPPRPFDPIAPSPRENQKSPSPPPPKEAWPSPPRENQKSPSPPPPKEAWPSPPRENQKSPSPPPPRENQKSPSPPPPRENQKSPSPPPPRENQKSPSPPPPRENQKSPSPPPPRENQKSPSPPPPRENQKSPSPPPPRENQKSPSPPPPRENQKSPSPPPPRENQKSPSPPPPRENQKSPSPPPPRENQKSRAHHRPGRTRSPRAHHRPGRMGVL